jgi:Zn finger protein HypA/HybF involved in hydrogenase expression
MEGMMLRRDKWHETITEDRVMEAVEQDDNTGFCLACGDDAYGVEPDARRYRCETCGERQVYGAEELALYLGA